MPIDDATWEQVRAAYADPKDTVVEICNRFNIRHQDLYARRSAENWPLRDKGKSDRLRRVPASACDKSSDATTAKSHAASSRAARAALILRLYNAIDLKLTQMEQRMSDPEATRQTSSADHEREARTLTGLVRNFERVTEMDADLTKPAGKSAAAKSSRPGTAAATDGTSACGPAPLTTAAALAADPARAMLLRRDIAQRLERIMAKGNPPGDVG
ncbi:MAG: hypothetical protein ABL901_18465 [Hyphomicrobiaceae bacterium]